MTPELEQMTRKCTPYAGGAVLIGPLLLQELAAELQADRSSMVVRAVPTDLVEKLQTEWDRTHPAGRHLLDELHAIGTYRAKRAEADALQLAWLRQKGQQAEADQLLRVAEDVEEEPDRA